MQKKNPANLNPNSDSLQILFLIYSQATQCFIIQKAKYTFKKEFIIVWLDESFSADSPSWKVVSSDKVSSG